MAAWQIWALSSAVFAALTAIFAKIGVEHVTAPTSRHSSAPSRSLWRSQHGGDAAVPGYREDFRA